MDVHMDEETVTGMKILKGFFFFSFIISNYTQSGVYFL